MITYYKLKTQHLKIQRKKLSLLTNKSYKTLGGLADKVKYDSEDISRLSKKEILPVSTQ